LLVVRDRLHLASATCGRGVQMFGAKTCAVNPLDALGCWGVCKR
jgi:hypothetical protein